MYMNSIQLLQEQFKDAHQALEATMADVSHDTAHFRELGKALPVGAAYAHAILSEDVMLSNLLAHKETLFKTPESVGVSEAMPDMQHWDQHAMWAQNVQIDMPKFKEFAKKVYTATDEYISSLKEDDLDKEIDDALFGKHTLAFFITNILLLHIANLTGEVSAVKGLQGLKGYPF